MAGDVTSVWGFLPSSQSQQGLRGVALPECSEEGCVDPIGLLSVAPGLRKDSSSSATRLGQKGLYTASQGTVRACHLPGSLREWSPVPAQNPSPLPSTRGSSQVLPSPRKFVSMFPDAVSHGPLHAPQRPRWGPLGCHLVTRPHQSCQQFFSVWAIKTTSTENSLRVGYVLYLGAIQVQGLASCRPASVCGMDKETKGWMDKWMEDG